LRFLGTKRGKRKPNLKDKIAEEARKGYGSLPVEIRRAAGGAYDFSKRKGPAFREKSQKGKKEVTKIVSRRLRVLRRR